LYFAKEDGLNYRKALDLTGFQEKVALRNIKTSVLGIVVFIALWFKIIKGFKSMQMKYMKNYLIAFFSLFFYIYAVILTNGPFIDPIDYYFYLILSFSDSFLLVLYLIINNYIWISGAFMWCSLPKIFWIISLY
jgi:hypothetical protein